MKTSTYYQSVKPEAKEVTNTDLLKAVIYLSTALFVTTVVFSNIVGKVAEMLYKLLF